MAGNPVRAVRTRIMALYDLGTASGMSDRELLEHFARRRDHAGELAFAALVERHGPMVLRVCRSILRDTDQAMDAFQATFFVLARKGPSLWIRESVAPWLHRVACRAASRARSAAARRRMIERQAAEMAEAGIAGSRSTSVNDIDELGKVIHEEINRLPERYRSVIVLCDLEGRTQQEASKDLGCPLGTIGSRLTRGREQLRERLLRRGFAPSLATGFGNAVPPAELIAQATISMSLVNTTAASALQFVSRRSVLEGTAVSLSTEVLRTMSISQVWKAASILLTVGLGMASTGMAVHAAKGNGGAGGDLEAQAASTTPKPTQSSEPDTAKASKAAKNADREEPDNDRNNLDKIGGFATVEPSKLSAAIETNGRIEVATSVSVVAKIDRTAPILSILPDGTKVKKGDIVCELDPSILTENLAAQEIATNKARASEETAKNAKAAALMAQMEYRDGISQVEAVGTKRKLTEAQRGVERAKQRVERVEEILSEVKKNKAKSTEELITILDLHDRLDAATTTLDREQTAFEVSESQVGLLKLTTERRLVELKANCAKAEAIAQAEALALGAEITKEDTLRKAIDQYVLRAPADGTVLHGADVSYSTRSALAGASHPSRQMFAGTSIDPNQLVFRIAPVDGPLRVTIRIEEATVNQVKPGQVAHVRVDAIPDAVFNGVVKEVAQFPDPNENGYPIVISLYQVEIQLDQIDPRLRAGMTSIVEVEIKTLDGVVSVPKRAVVLYAGKSYLAVKSTDSEMSWREVTLGLGSHDRIEIKQGLKAGEKVAFAPEPLLDDKRMPDLTSKSDFQAESVPQVGLTGAEASATRRHPGGEVRILGEVVARRSLLTKLRAMSQDDFDTLRSADPNVRLKTLRNAGFTEDEINQLNKSAPVPVNSR